MTKTGKMAHVSEGDQDNQLGDFVETENRVLPLFISLWPPIDFRRRRDGRIQGAKALSLPILYVYAFDGVSFVNVRKPDPSALKPVVRALTPKEERVLRMRFGVGMERAFTFEEIGDHFSITRERIRQIEAKALRKLKHPRRRRRLRSFLDD